MKVTKKIFNVSIGQRHVRVFISENGFTDPLSTSVVYFDYLRDAESANGWVKASANMWPCKITNGQLTYINFELR